MEKKIAFSSLFILRTTNITAGDAFSELIPTILTVMVTYLWIMLGGALGTGARFWLSGVIAGAIGEAFPLGTLIVNVSGSFVIGFFAGLIDPQGPFLIGPRLRQFVMIGVCGGYTTFSSFSLQTLELARAGDWLRAGLNCFLSLFACLLAVWLGRVLALLLFSR